MTEPPIRIGHPDRPGVAGDTCGCCDGTTLATMAPLANRASLSAIEYRIGDHGAFKASMLANLASSRFPQLAGLGTRKDDDFSIALMDAWAVSMDVLSFYQERLANEAYIGTATERLSITEIARLIGYGLHPGSAAATDLVFLMDDPPGAEPDVTDLEIPEGTRVQSQPGPDEVPQIFETLAALEARVAWNRMRPRQARYVAPAEDDTGIWLDGFPALQKGDAIVIVGRDRAEVDTGSELWDFRRLVEIRPETALGKTWVRFDRPLGSDFPHGLPAQAGHRVFLLRERASLFGYNAPHPRSLSADQRSDFGFELQVSVIAAALTSQPIYPSPSRIQGSLGNVGDWVFNLSTTARRISLDAIYKGFTKGSWCVLTLPTGLVELYQIEEARDDSEARYAISGKASRLTLDTDEGLSEFADAYRRVSVYGASEELALAEGPLSVPVAGQIVELDGAVPDLPAERRLMFTGRRAQKLVLDDGLVVMPPEGAGQALDPGQRVTLMADPVPVPGGFQWQLRDADGFEGTVEAAGTAFADVIADKTAGVVGESAILGSVTAADKTHTQLILSGDLTHAYDRTDLSIHGNVAGATHGESVSDILGGGDPSKPFQAAVLKQSPVTHLVAATETGVASSLELRIDGVRWSELPDLYQRGAAARVFTTQMTDAGETVLRFGDGTSGARPPAGRDNIEASYRIGLGLSGNVRAGQLSLPLDRPLGLREIVNPLAASGGADAEPAEAARHNAPIHTLTLGRIVSITDYRDFALGYPGVARADARWVWQGDTRRVVVTVAGDDGADIPTDGPLFEALLAAFRRYGDPLVTFNLLTMQPVHFRLGMKVVVDPDHEVKTVLAAVEAALRAAYSFGRRDFAQNVALSGVAAQAHRVPGVVAVDIDRLYREIAPQAYPTDHRLLESRTGRAGAGDTLLAAEILTLSPAPFDSLEVMA